jgi:hypothetical protein
MRPRIKPPPSSEEAEGYIGYDDIEALQRAHELGLSQQQTLNLQSWENPTSYFFWQDSYLEEVLAAGPWYYVDDGSICATFKCATLADRLLDHGLSLHEPDPERALHDTEYRQSIANRVRQLRIANWRGLTDQALATVIKLAPWPIFRDSYEDPGAEKALAEFRCLLAQRPARTIAACEEIFHALRKEYRARIRKEPQNALQTTPS